MIREGNISTLLSSRQDYFVSRNQTIDWLAKRVSNTPTMVIGAQALEAIILSYIAVKGTPVHATDIFLQTTLAGGFGGIVAYGFNMYCAMKKKSPVTT